jgi:hypothetical protein
LACFLVYKNNGSIGPRRVAQAFADMEAPIAIRDGFLFFAAIVGAFPFESNIDKAMPGFILSCGALAVSAKSVICFGVKALRRLSASHPFTGLSSDDALVPRQYLPDSRSLRTRCTGCWSASPEGH